MFVNSGLFGTFLTILSKRTEANARARLSGGKSGRESDQSDESDASDLSDSPTPIGLYFFVYFLCIFFASG